MKSFTIGDKHFVTIRAPKDKEKGAFVIDISAFVPMSAYTDRFFHGSICVSFNKARRLRDLINQLLSEEAKSKTAFDSCVCKECR